MECLKRRRTKQRSVSKEYGEIFEPIREVLFHMNISTDHCVHA